MKQNKDYLELKLLLLSLAILFIALTTYAEETPSIKNYLNTYFQKSILLDELYAKDKVDSGTNGRTITRKELEEGKIAFIRYGSKKNEGEESFPDSNIATSEVVHRIQHFLTGKENAFLKNPLTKFETGKNPDFMPEDLLLSLDSLTPEQKLKRKDLLEKYIRKLFGYTMAEQLYAIRKNEEEKKRPLTPAEITKIKQMYPLKQDKQVDEFETLAIIKNMTVDQIHHIFMDQDNYPKMLPAYFKVAHILTPNELRIRNITLAPNENVFYAHYQMDDRVIKYIVLNRWATEPRKVTLQTKNGLQETIINALITT